MTWPNWHLFAIELRTKVASSLEKNGKPKTKQKNDDEESKRPIKRPRLKPSQYIPILKIQINFRSKWYYNFIMQSFDHINRCTLYEGLIDLAR